MQDSYVVYFEGLPGSGKSTLISRLANNYPDLFVCIPEYLDPTAANEASSRGDQQYFLQNDEAKFSRARASSRVALVDRGHLSTIFYSQAHELIKGTPLIDVEQWYIQKILNRNMLPDLYIHLDSSPQTTFSRRPKTAGWDNMWDHEKALQLARKNFTQYVKQYESQVPVLRLNSDALSMEELEARCVEYIKSHAPHANVNAPSEVLFA